VFDGTSRITRFSSRRSALSTAAPSNANAMRCTASMIAKVAALSLTNTPIGDASSASK